MIKGWKQLTTVHGGIAGGFLLALLFGDNNNMFTLPIFTVFTMSTAYCALQWHVSKLFKKIESKHPDWK